MSDSKPWHVWVVGRDDEGELTDNATKDSMLEQAKVCRSYYCETEAQAAEKAHEIAKALRAAGALPERWTVCYAKGRTNEVQDEGHVHTPQIVHLDE